MSSLKISHSEKEESRPLTMAVTERFVKAMQYIIATNKDVVNQEDFARKMGILPQNLSLIKSLNRNIMLEHVVRICMDFGISAEWLLLGTGEIMASKQDSILSEIEHLKERVRRLENK